MRIHIGGQILVANPDDAPPSLDRSEIVSGADRIFSLAGDRYDLPEIDPVQWRPRKAVRLIDEEAGDSAVHIYRIGPASVLIDARSEPHTVLLGDGALQNFDRWTDGAVVVLFGDGGTMSKAGRALLDRARPRLIALAAGDLAIDSAIAALRDRLDGVPLVSLEPALALEA